ncbi:MAG: 2-oxoacid:acceptor oxidoreductase subunit alpha [Candidatus Diapherotrites archaeon]|nr:2-oxoacid:acceptor oxidoreductase subunit alpha [Candidatus Diapherotrites archaeon]
MKVNDLTWRVGGEAGFGILSAGSMLAKCAQRAGLYAYANSEYPSLIRGGHNFLHVRINEKPITAHRKPISVLVALNDETIKLHQTLVSKDGCILFDSNKVPDTGHIRKDVRVYPVPLVDITRQLGAPEIVRNTVSLGASFAILSFDMSFLEEALREQFSGKDEKIIELNIKAAHAGFDFIKNNFREFKEPFAYRLEKRGKKDNILVNGNDAISIGAIKAGLKFYAAYPMTPASSILNFVAAHDKEYNIMVKQTEDEIAAMNMVVGASFAGARSMTGTSGGGFDLMVEGLSMAGMLETPIVAVEAMRPGPSTGMPTRTDQGDLQMILNAGHGEFDKVVICPGDPTECFYAGFDSFNIAEHFQLPVLIVTDKFLADSLETVPPFRFDHLKINRGWMVSDEEAQKYFENSRFKRSLFGTKDGISPRAIPGQKFGIHRATTDEHDEFGDITSHEPADERIKQVDRRFRKLEGGIDAIKAIGINTKAVNVFTNFEGNAGDAEISIVSWGSTKGIILDAMEMLKAEHKIAFLQIIYANPFPDREVGEFLNKAGLIVNVETNKMSQMAKLIREKTGIPLENHVNRYDGRPFDPDDLAEDIKKIASQKAKTAKNFPDAKNAKPKAAQKKAKAKPKRKK